MTDCTIYDKTTGEILSYGTVSDETLELYVNQGHDVLLDVHGDPAKQYVVDDNLVDYTADELAARAAMRPGQIWSMPSRTVVDARLLADLAAQAQVLIDAQGDAARESVIINPTKSLEYQRAEAQARPYAAAGYPDPVPSCVDSWARAKRWTNGGVPWTGKRAADDIIATADLWNGALDGIRDLRLDAKQHIDAIVADPNGTTADVDAVVAQFEADLATLMGRL